MSTFFLIVVLKTQICHQDRYRLKNSFVKIYPFELDLTVRIETPMVYPETFEALSTNNAIFCFKEGMLQNFFEARPSKQINS